MKEIKPEFSIGDKLYYMDRDAIRTFEVKGIDINIRGTASEPKIKIEYIANRTGEGHYEERVARSVDDLWEKVNLED